jgi:hypothetical protein
VSWVATLLCVCCSSELGDWNYTHNTNGMIAAALESQGAPKVEEASGPLGPVIGPAWWRQLHDQEGPAGAALLDRIICGLAADPERFVAMNPKNGWGTYHGLVRVLSEMRDAVPEHRTRWYVIG